MGMFDDLTCKYPLPMVNASEWSFQTKALDCLMDRYEIREDGTLWHEAYESRVEESEDAPLGIWLHRDNRRWEPVNYTGEVRFYNYFKDADWVEFSAYFVNGALKQMETIKLPDHLRSCLSSAQEQAVTPAASEAK